MTRNISTAAARSTIISAFAALVVAAAIPQASFAKSPSDAGMWTVNLAKSKFGAGANTLVLEQRGHGAKAADAKSNPAASSFLVVSGGNIYLATDTVAAASGNAITQVDYNRWSELKLIKIGDRVRSTGVCSFRCQQGLRDNRPMTLTFAGNGIDPSGQMNTNIVVLNAR